MIPKLIKDPSQIVVDMINADNNSHLIAEQLRFGVPVVIEGPRNTRILVTARPYSGMVGSVEVEYNRIDLDTIPLPDDPRLFYTSQTTLRVSDIVPLINETYGINLTATDYVDAVLVAPAITDPALPFSLKAAAKSLIYTGLMSLSLANEATRNDISLPLEMVNTYFNGFTYAFLTT